MDGLDRPDRPNTHPATWSDEMVARLWRAHRRWLAAVVYAHKPRDIDVEDLLQDVAVKLVRNIHALDDPESIRPWLRTVAVNVARSAGRRARSKSNAHRAIEREQTPARVAGDGTAIEQPGGVRSIEDARTRGRRALELVDGLPPHYREPLLLSLRGLSQKQIAETMDVPLTTVETRLIRARKMLRQEMMNDDRTSDSGEACSPVSIAPEQDGETVGHMP